MDPQPDNIPNYPPNAQVTFLFTKTLTKTDIREGLVFIKAGNDYIKDLCTIAGVLEKVNNKEFKTTVYTPSSHTNIGLRLGSFRKDTFRLNKNGWDKLVKENGFEEGVKIECWGLYDATQLPDDCINFLMRKAVITGIVILFSNYHLIILGIYVNFMIKAS